MTSIASEAKTSTSTHHRTDQGYGRYASALPIPNVIPPQDKQPIPLIKESQPYRYAPPKVGDPWETCMNLIDKYDDDACRGWREDIDSLLVFAGLFSAVVTAFTVESYQWLEDAPSDASAQILYHISQQLNDVSIPAAIAPSETAFYPSASAIRINVFWFSSLTLGLSSALLGILCKQWLREFQRDAAISPKDALILRQLRLQGLERWRVPQIVGSLSVILQAALILFFAGLLDLLWDRGAAIVAIFASIIVGLMVTIVILTTVLPSCQFAWSYRNFRVGSEPPYPCPYRSPQSWLFHQAVVFVSRAALVAWVRIKTRDFTYPYHRISYIFPRHENWLSLEMYLRTRPGVPVSCLFRSLKWVYSTLGNSYKTTDCLLHCLMECDTSREPMETSASRQLFPKETVDLRYYQVVVHSHQPSWMYGIHRNFGVELLLRTISAPSAYEDLDFAVRTIVNSGVITDLEEDLLVETLRTFTTLLSSDPVPLYPLLSWHDLLFDARRNPSYTDIQFHLEALIDAFGVWLDKRPPGYSECEESIRYCAVTFAFLLQRHDDSASWATTSPFLKLFAFLEEQSAARGINLETLTIPWSKARQRMRELEQMILETGVSCTTHPDVATPNEERAE